MAFVGVNFDNNSRPLLINWILGLDIYYIWPFSLLTQEHTLLLPMQKFTALSFH